LCVVLLGLYLANDPMTMQLTD